MVRLKLVINIFLPLKIYQTNNLPIQLFVIFNVSYESKE